VSFRVAHLDEIGALPGPGTLTWHPVRATLGIRAFGTNAYTASEPGADVVEPHTENPDLGHEELYFVARGRATFTIDGESFDAPEGTYVFVPEPSSHRHAVAAEAGTTVLSFGGPPTFAPSAWEWFFRADAIMRTDPARARVILEEGLAAHPQSPGLQYTLACLEALEGHPDEALAALGAAIGGDPDLREHARTDEDLASLRADGRLAALLG
jgi:hypothetical protein